MTKPTTARFGKFFVRLGDGDSPEEFTAPCGFTSKAWNRGKNLNEVNIPDCDDPDAPASVARDVVSTTASITGDGILAKSALPLWEAAYKSNAPVNCEVELVFEDSSTEVWEGKFHLETFNITGTQGERVNVSVSMQSDGDITHTSGSGSSGS